MRSRDVILRERASGSEIDEEKFGPDGHREGQEARPTWGNTGLRGVADA
jgi:hypothetical protein